MISETSIFPQVYQHFWGGASEPDRCRIHVFPIILLPAAGKLHYTIIAESVIFKIHAGFISLLQTQNCYKNVCDSKYVTFSHTFAATNSIMDASTFLVLRRVFRTVKQWLLRVRTFGEGYTFTICSFHFSSFFFRGPPLLSIWYNDFQCFSVGTFLLFLFSWQLFYVFLVPFSVWFFQNLSRLQGKPHFRDFRKYEKHG